MPCWKNNEIVLNEGRAYPEHVMVMKQRLQICLNSMVDTYLTLRKGIGTCGTFGSHMVLGIKVSVDIFFCQGQPKLVVPISLLPL